MKANWTIANRKADFRAWSQELGVSPLVCKLIRNRGIETVDEAKNYLEGTMDSLGDPYLLKDMGKAADLIQKAVDSGERIAISSDYDDDGIFSARILLEGIRNIGGQAIIYSPNRMTEGYGMNHRIVDEAYGQGAKLILTCDNGIAAFDAVSYAKSLGLTVVVTDHHEVQYEDVNGERKYLLPEADAIVDPKQEDSEYPFKEYCGAGVAFRLVQVLYEKYGIPKEKEEELYEYVAIATVADVVSLRGENRTMVREGMKRLHETKKVPFLALCQAQGIRPQDVNSYQIGFVIGPCFNAIGRLGTVDLAFKFLEMTDMPEAVQTAEFIKSLNDERKLITEEGFQKCVEQIENAPWKEDHIYTVVLEGVHESIVGIIAGRVKEKYSRPAFVFTKTEEGFLKGSGRSISAYNMIEELMKVKALLLRFGGHKMAAGLSLSVENLEEFRRVLNENQTLSEDDLVPQIELDALVQFYGLNENLVEEIGRLEPFGMGNPRPILGVKNAGVINFSVRGKQRQIMTMLLEDDTHHKQNAVCFKDPEEFLAFMDESFGESCVTALKNRAIRSLPVSFAFYPVINDYRGEKRVQIVVENYCITK